MDLRFLYRLANGEQIEFTQGDAVFWAWCKIGQSWAVGAAFDPELTP